MGYKEKDESTGRGKNSESELASGGMGPVLEYRGKSLHREREKVGFLGDTTGKEREDLKVKLRREGDEPRARRGEKSEKNRMSRGGAHEEEAPFRSSSEETGVESRRDTKSKKLCLLACGEGGRKKWGEESTSNG